ncbi:MAG: hypothetical protein IPM69_01995 [Ignavibacteria bacterium]|nr:hypothetical protein [Ignavibacteria bacterium]
MNRLFTIGGMILLAAISRILPHPPNFAPITAMALFGGAYFNDRRLAFIVPLLAMLISDSIIGFHSTQPVVYACFALITLLGFRLQNNKSIGKIALASVAGSTIFFIITNFAVWIMGDFYPHTLSGLVMCFAAGIPFYSSSIFSSPALNTFFGDLTYTSLFFGAFAFAEMKIPSLARK